MKIALIGVTGQVGSRILAELLQRGHEVTGIARDPSRARPRPGLTLKAADATEVEALAAVLAGHDAVISATRFVSAEVTALVAASKRAGVKRLLK